MSDQAQATGQEKQAGTLPDPDSAYAHLFDTVHSNVFFGRLASIGIGPTNEKEAQDLLMLAGRLREADEQEKVAGDSRFGAPLEALDSVLGGPGGIAKQAADADEALMIKQAAAELAGDPTIYNCVLSLKAQEAAIIADQMGGGQTE